MTSGNVNVIDGTLTWFVMREQEHDLGGIRVIEDWTNLLNLAIRIKGVEVAAVDYCL